MVLGIAKELVNWTGIGRSLTARGISVLCVDQPGSGEALRLKNLPGVYDSERWASRAVDYLETRSDVDKSRIGMFGLSLGGYFAPRAAAVSKRFSLSRLLGSY